VIAPPNPGHLPVMREEVVTALRPRAGARFIDATFGGGGHTALLLESSAPDGRVVAIDADPEAQSRSEVIRASLDDPNRLVLVQANFSEISSVAEQHRFTGVDGILFDLGLSSFQLDDPERGFAFRTDGPLDMRMNPDTHPSAAELIATIDELSLMRLLREYGEEPRARQIARAIVQEREKEPIVSTAQFAALVEKAVGGRRGAKTHPATRTFQAVRIAVNQELDSIERGVRSAIDLLAPGGRLVTIAFHSLEDRLVKRIIQEESATCVCPPEIPVCVCEATPRLRRVGGSRKPSSAEIAHNPRARSAIMRIAERLPDAS
jgi:16S rRNA (cytosine1402-N4)-methyltransferase